jgi:hypothetical protein
VANRLEQFYNVDQAVGKNKSNAQDDVLLVRFFLSALKGSGFGDVYGFKPPGTLPVITSWDQQLTDWIIAFQTCVKNQATGTLIDGIVDAARGTATQKSTISHSIYTIVLLNRAYKAGNEKSHAALWLDPAVPAQLRASLLARVA